MVVFNAVLKHFHLLDSEAGDSTSRERYRKACRFISQCPMTAIIAGFLWIQSGTGTE
jgi:hypothetical protein